jgi:hypothetical protein
VGVGYAVLRVVTGHQPGMQRGYPESLLGGRSEVKAVRRLINAVTRGYMSADQVIEAHHVRYASRPGVLHTLIAAGMSTSRKNDMLIFYAYFTSKNMPYALRLVTRNIVLDVYTFVFYGQVC